MSLADLRGPTVGLRDLDWLLTPEHAARAFTDAGLRVARADPNYVRLKPGRGAIVGYVLRGFDDDGQSVSVPAYARTFADEHVRVVAAKWSGTRPVSTPLGPGFALLEGGQTALFVFPNDARLRVLRKLEGVLTGVGNLLSEQLGAGREATALTAVRYKPERRFIGSATVRSRGNHVPDADGAGVFLRLFGDERGERLANLAALIRSQGGSSLVPRPFGAVLEGRVFVEERVQGEEYLPALLAGRADPLALAEALTRLHRCVAPGTAPRTPSELLDAISTGLEAAAAVDESLSDPAKELVKALAGMTPAASWTAFVHGDLALHNVLDSADGPVIVDLERATTGDPLQDLGKVVAHVRAVGTQIPEAREQLREFEERLVEAYAHASGRSLEGLPFFVACALADRAAGSVLRRTLHNWWPSRPSELLDLALNVTREKKAAVPTFFMSDNPIGAGARWEVFYPKNGGKWAGFLQDPSGGVIYGTYDPATDSFSEVRPEDDPELPALARWIGQGDLVNYRVGRRATVRVPPRDGRAAAFVKIRPLAKMKVLRRYRAVHDLLTTTRGAPPVPPLLEYRPEEGFLVLAEVPGRSLRELILDGGDDVDAGIEAAARAVIQLHSIRETPIDAPPLRAPMQPEAYAALAATYAPEAAARYRAAAQEVSEAVQRTEPVEDRVVHGDLHDGNVLLDGGQAAILDLDLIHPGDPAEDVGNMMAHLLLRTVQTGGGLDVGRRRSDQFMRAYHRAGDTLDRASVRAWGALALFRLSCIYLFRRRWRTLTPTLLDEAVRWARVSSAAQDQVRAS